MSKKAFTATMKDPEFLKDAKNSKLEIQPMDGPTAAKGFARMYDLKPGIKAKLKEIVLTTK
jgi:hypothetical protein